MYYLVILANYRNVLFSNLHLNTRRSGGVPNDVLMFLRSSADTFPLKPGGSWGGHASRPFLRVPPSLRHLPSTN